MTKVSEPELSDTPIVGVRLGSLRPRLEAFCERRKIDMSTVIRQAVEKELHTDPAETYVLLLQAVRAFRKLMETAHDAGLIEEKAWAPLKESLWGAIFLRNGLQDQIEERFEKTHPEAVEAEKELEKKREEWKQGGRKGPEPGLKNDVRGDWLWKLRDRYDFPDLRRAGSLLLELKDTETITQKKL